MKLYRYSDKLFKRIETLETQRDITEAERKEAEQLRKQHMDVPPGFYYQHISFFLEPIPTDFYKYFHKDHPFWRQGVSLYQYTVDSSKIGSFDWMIVELPQITDARYDEQISDSEYWKLYKKIYKDFAGKDNIAFEKAAKPFVGKIEQFANLAFALNPNSTKYAADIPHVMLYPEYGAVLYDSVEKITLK